MRFETRPNVYPARPVYEYNVFVAPLAAGPTEILEVLNGRGKEGWDVFEVTEDVVTPHLIFWLKRVVAYEAR